MRRWAYRSHPIRVKLLAQHRARPLAPPTSNSSYPPPVCDGPYIQFASDTVCTSILPNENYLAVLTQRSSTHHTTGEQVRDWLDGVGGSFQLAWSSLPESPQPNASAPPTNLVVSTPNATNAPGDLHVFYRSTVGLRIERMIDGLARQRVDDWHFTPLYRRQSKWAYGLEYHYEFHQLLLPKLRVRAAEWPQTDYRQLIPEIQSVLSPGSLLERHTRRLGSPESFQVFPAERDGFKQLDLEQRLQSVPGVTGVSFYERSFYLPGDRCVPCGGPSGGPGVGAATAVPISSTASRGLLILGLVLAGFYWMRRPG